MTPRAYTEHYQPSANKDAAMLAYTGKRLTTRITNHVQEKLQAAADLVGATLICRLSGSGKSGKGH